MRHHTWEPTVLSRASCRPSHLNFHRFHQLRLFSWAHFQDRWGLSDPRTTWRSLTLAGSPVLPPLCLTGGFCHADWTVPRQDVNSPFHLLRCHSLQGVCTPASSGLCESAAPVYGMPWRPHPPRHQIVMA